MGLEQYADVRAWHLGHREHAIEFLVWNGVMTLWMLGWVGLPASALLHHRAAALTACALCLLPALYVRLRRRLHRLGWLRCDWIGALGRGGR